MKKKAGMTLFICIVLMTNFSAMSQQPLEYTLEDIVTRAKNRSPAALRAETRKENRYYQYRFFRSNYNPQLRLGGCFGFPKKKVRS